MKKCKHIIFGIVAAISLQCLSGVTAFAHSDTYTEFIEDFNAKSKIEVQVISKSGKIWSSSGFTVDSKNVKTEDVNEAFEGKTGVSKWSGFNENG